MVIAMAVLPIPGNPLSADNARLSPANQAMRHWLRGDGGIVEKHCVGRRRCDLSEYLIRLVPIGASLISCKQAEFLGVHAKEFTELAAVIGPGRGGAGLPPTHIVSFGINPGRHIFLRPTTQFTLVLQPAIRLSLTFGSLFRQSDAHQ